MTQAGKPRFPRNCHSGRKPGPVGTSGTNPKSHRRRKWFSENRFGRFVAAPLSSARSLHSHPPTSVSRREKAHAELNAHSEPLSAALIAIVGLAPNRRDTSVSPSLIRLSADDRSVRKEGAKTMAEEKIIGIDLGTTNSVVAVMEGNEVKVI